MNINFKIIICSKGKIYFSFFSIIQEEIYVQVLCFLTNPVHGTRVYILCTINSTQKDKIYLKNNNDFQAILLNATCKKIELMRAEGLNSRQEI